MDFNNIKRWLIVLFSIHASMFSMLAVAGPIIEGGKLTGFKGVYVEGRLYNVEFVDGTCISLFEGCSEFPFNTLYSATLAAQALLDQVLVDDALGAFDSDPERTYGCLNNSRCAIYTPYFTSFPEGSSVLNVVAINWDPEFASDFVFRGEIPASLDLTDSITKVYVRWVPEPGGFSLLGLGLIILGWFHTKS